MLCRVSLLFKILRGSSLMIFPGAQRAFYTHNVELYMCECLIQAGINTSTVTSVFFTALLQRI
jgi:hypothetical protein